MARDFRNRKNVNLSGEATNYGDVLRRARERHGISLDEVAQDLHVRTDILIALEDGDFSKIPPQGYSRNMIKSYARLLGLDAIKITNMFLDAEYSFQISRKRESAQQISDENKKRVPRTVKPSNGYKTPRQQIEEERQYKRMQENSREGKTETTFGGRTVHVFGNKYKNTPRARRELDIESNPSRNQLNYSSSTKTNRDLLEGDDYKSAKERLESRKRKNMLGRQKLSRKDSYTLNEEENPNAIRPIENENPSYNFMNVYQNKGTNNSAQSKMMIPIIAAAVVLLVIILVCVFFFIGKQHENDKTDVSKLNVVGISDVENPSKNENNDDKDENAKNAAEPKEVEFKYKVKDGASVYMEIYEGSNTRPTLARMVKSGETNTFKVTDSLKFVTSSPNSVEIYANNELVQPTDATGNGVYTYTLNFNEWLTAWKTKHKTSN